MRRLTDLCSALILIALAVLGLRPETGWVLRTQRDLVFGRHYGALERQAAGDPGTVEQRARYATTAEPTVAIASALADKSALLPTVVQRFPNDPAVCAARVRALLSAAGRLSEIPLEIEAVLHPGAAPSGVSLEDAESGPPTPLQLTAMVREAERGGDLDPGNAFFLAIRAYALLGLHRDTDALAALHQAAEMPRYDDYVGVEITGRLALLDRLYGEHTALGDVVQASAAVLPHSAALRTLARAAVCRAIRREQAGKPEEGLAIRRDIRLLARNIREGASTAISIIVARGMHDLAGAFPRKTAAPSSKKASGNEAEQERDERHRTYQAYLRQQGAAQEAAAYAADDQRYAALKAANTKFWETHEWQGRAWELGGSWAQGTATLLLILILFLVGGVGRALQCTAVYRTGKSAPVGVRIGLWLTLGVAPLCVLAAVTMECCPQLSAIGWFAAGAALFPTLWPLTANRSARVFGQGAAVLSVVLAVFLVTVALLLAPLGVMGAAISVYQCNNDGIPLFSESLWEHVPQAAVYAPFALALPLLLLVVLAMVSRVKRLPVTVGVVRFLPGASVFLATLLCMGHGYFVWRTASLERVLRQEIRYVEPQTGTLLRASVAQR